MCEFVQKTRLGKSRVLKSHKSRFSESKSPNSSKSVDLAEKYANNLTFEATPNERYALVTSAFSHAN